MYVFNVDDLARAGWPVTMWHIVGADVKYKSKLELEEKSEHSDVYSCSCHCVCRGKIRLEKYQC